MRFSRRVRRLALLIGVAAIVAFCLSLFVPISAGAQTSFGAAVADLQTRSYHFDPLSEPIPGLSSAQEQVVENDLGRPSATRVFFASLPQTAIPGWDPTSSTAAASAANTIAHAVGVPGVYVVYATAPGSGRLGVYSTTPRVPEAQVGSLFRSAFRLGDLFDTVQNFVLSAQSFGQGGVTYGAPTHHSTSSGRRSSSSSMPVWVMLAFVGFVILIVVGALIWVVLRARRRQVEERREAARAFNSRKHSLEVEISGLEDKVRTFVSPDPDLLPRAQDALIQANNIMGTAETLEDLATVKECLDRARRALGDTNEEPAPRRPSPRPRRNPEPRRRVEPPVETVAARSPVMAPPPVVRVNVPQTPLPRGQFPQPVRFYNQLNTYAPGYFGPSSPACYMGVGLGEYLINGQLVVGYFDQRRRFVMAPQDWLFDFELMEAFNETVFIGCNPLFDRYFDLDDVGFVAGFDDVNFGDPDGAVDVVVIDPGDGLAGTTEDENDDGDVDPDDDTGQGDQPDDETNGPSDEVFTDSSSADVTFGDDSSPDDYVSDATFD